MRYKLIATLQVLKRHGLTNDHVDERLLATCVQRGQDIDLKNELGIKMIRDLQSKSVYTTFEKELIDDYIVPYMAIVVDQRASEALSNRIRNSGVGKANASEYTNNSTEENRQFNNSLFWDGQSLVKSLNSFIRKNRKEFPFYDNSNGCMNPTHGDMMNKIDVI